MLTCFLCKLKLKSAKLLLLHIQVVHHHNGDIQNYRCIEDTCTIRDFNNVFSFKRHLQRHEKTCLQETNNQTQIPIDAIANDPIQINNAPQGLDAHIEVPVHDRLIDGALGMDIQNENLNRTNENTYCEMLADHAANYVAELYNNVSIPRKHIQYVVDSTSNFMSGGPVTVLKETVLGIMQTNNVPRDDTRHVEKLFDALEMPFENLSSEYLRFKYFTNNGTIIKPVNVTLGHMVMNNRMGIAELSPLNGSFIPLREVLTAFFNMPNVLEEVLQYVRGLDRSEMICNFMQGSLWKEKTKDFPDRTILPLFLYFDEFETGNVLGAHAGVYKIGATYITLPFLPPEFHSTLENIFLALLFISNDRKQVGNKRAFGKLIEELQFLESVGIVIQDKQIYFMLGLILGDNLGLHSIMGFVEGFTANYVCRFCKCHKTILRAHVTECVESLRDRNNDEVDVNLKDVSRTGINERCVWNQIESFHVVDNFCVDIMHDLLEGVCSYDMCLVLDSLISCSKLFTIQELNSKIQYFNYGKAESNKPPSITIENIKNQHLKMSSSEMLCFIRYAGLIFGDLVPRGNNVWQLYIILRQIISLVTAKSLQPSCYILLRNLIEEHHTLYLSLFPTSHLKPKHHFMVHYPKILEMAGPLVLLWSMRGESKHRDGKKIANSVASRVDICQTISIKQQLKLNLRLMQNRGLQKNIVIGSGYNVNFLQDVYNHRCPEGFPVHLFEEACKSVQWVDVMGTQYRTDMVLVLDVLHDYPVFGLIHDIIVNQRNDICFILYNLSTVCFCDHFQSYQVTNTGSKICATLASIIPVHPSFLARISGELYVSLRYSF